MEAFSEVGQTMALYKVIPAAIAAIVCCIIGSCLFVINDNHTLYTTGVVVKIESKTTVIVAYTISEKYITALLTVPEYTMVDSKFDLAVNPDNLTDVVIQSNVNIKYVGLGLILCVAPIIVGVTYMTYYMTMHNKTYAAFSAMSQLNPLNQLNPMRWN